jgi:hypothetical protein
MKPAGPGSLLLVAALVACGEAARPPAPTPDGGVVRDAATADRASADLPPASPDLAADLPALAASEFVGRYCGFLGPCCQRAGLPGDGARCRGSLEGATGGPYHAPTAEACLMALREASAAPAFCTEGYLAAARLCDRVFAPVLAGKRPGDPCARAEECLLSAQGPVTCAGVGLGMGRCQVKARGKEGEGPCVGTVDGALTVAGGAPNETAARAYLCHVADGLWCDEGTRKCLRAKGAGEACSGFGECGAAHHCDDARLRCVPRLGAGAACTVDEQCQSVFCGEDNRCGPAPEVDGTLVRSCGGM